MAEVSFADKPQDWSTADRLAFNERWNRANVLNLLRGAEGANEYRTITERAAFYDWFDQIRELQGHEILWPAAAWVVASQMANLEDPVRMAFMAARRASLGRSVDSERLLQFGRDGNRVIFNDVFPRLKDVFERGFVNDPIKGPQAEAWDKATLRHEQFDVVQSVYERYAGNDSDIAAELGDLASGRGVLTLGGLAIGNALDFSGAILAAQDRYAHGMNVVIPVYKRFKQAISGSRNHRQVTKPDPTGGGMVAPVKLKARLISNANLASLTERGRQIARQRDTLKMWQQLFSKVPPQSLKLAEYWWEVYQRHKESIADERLQKEILALTKQMEALQKQTNAIFLQYQDKLRAIADAQKRMAMFDQIGALLNLVQTGVSAVQFLNQGGQPISDNGQPEISTPARGKYTVERVQDLQGGLGQLRIQFNSNARDFAELNEQIRTHYRTLAVPLGIMPDPPDTVPMNGQTDQ